MIEFDLCFNPEAACIRPNLADGAILDDPHRLEYPDALTGLVENLDARLIDGVHDRSRATVHDRHFRTIDLDHRVVNPEASQGCEHVLGGRHQRPRRISEHGRKFGRGHIANLGPNLAFASAFKTGSQEYNSTAGICRMERHRRRQTGMHADA
jgi:hypothetical protein